MRCWRLWEGRSGLWARRWPDVRILVVCEHGVRELICLSEMR